MKTKITLEDLNPGQRKAVATGVDWWNSDEQCLVINGEPGTGKTSIAEFTVKRIKSAIPLYSAPTHEAAGQLEDRVGDNAPCETTHRALGLKANRSYAELVFERGKPPKEFDPCTLLLVDEASMLDLAKPGEPDKLLNHALECYDKIIFLGDDMQLPPIGATESPVFTQGYRTITLDKVERHDGDILRYVQKVRAEIMKPARRVPEPFGEISQVKAKPGALPSLPEDVLRSIADGRGRVLTWTNGKTSHSIVPGVAEYNQMMRGFKFGAALAEKHPFLESEIVVLKAPNFLYERDADKHEELTSLEFESKSLKRMAATNARGQVTRVDTATLLGVECHKLTLDLIKGGKTVVFCPTKKGKVRYDQIMKQMLEQAKAEGGARLYAKRHTFAELFTLVVPSYGQTCQTAQGASIETVCVDVRNMLQCRDWKVAFKLLNVGCSRASKELILIRS